MTASTDFLPFATGSGANVESQAAYLTDTTTSLGFSAGVASSSKFNKALRQASFIAAGVATWTANTLGINVADDGNLSNFITNLNLAIAAMIPSIAGLMPIAGGTFTGAVAGLTPATADATTKLATTAMVQLAIAQKLATGTVVTVQVSGLITEITSVYPNGYVEKRIIGPMPSGSNYNSATQTFLTPFPTALLWMGSGNSLAVSSGSSWHPANIWFPSSLWSKTGFTVESDSGNSSMTILSGLTFSGTAFGN